MTIAQLEKRVAALEAEIRALKAQVAGSEQKPRSWLDLFGKYKDDPAFEEATRLGREWYEEEKRKSLEEFDREAAREAAGRKPRTQKAAAKKTKPRKANGRT